MSSAWACSSVGRAFGSHPRGREFESLQVHQQESVFSLLTKGAFSDLFTIIIKYDIIETTSNAAGGTDLLAGSKTI